MHFWPVRGTFLTAEQSIAYGLQYRPIPGGGGLQLVQFRRVEILAAPPSGWWNFFSSDPLRGTPRTFRRRGLASPACLVFLENKFTWFVLRHRVPSLGTPRGDCWSLGEIGKNDDFQAASSNEACGIVLPRDKRTGVEGTPRATEGEAQRHC